MEQRKNDDEQKKILLTRMTDEETINRLAHILYVQRQKILSGKQTVKEEEKHGSE